MEAIQAPPDLKGVNLKSKIQQSKFSFERNEIGARPQEPPHERAPGEGMSNPGVAIQWHFARAGLHEWHFSRPSPFYVNTKEIRRFNLTLPSEKTRHGLRLATARVSSIHPHATPASLRRSGADAPFRGFFSGSER